MTDTWSIPDPEFQPEFYADIPVKRLLAWVVDCVLIALVVLIVLPFTAFTGLFFLPFLYLVIGFLYRWMTLAGGSATWGMRLMAVEMRDGHGRRFDSMTAFLHTMGYSISLAFPILQVISVVMMLAGSRAQGLTDNVLGTVAINRRAGH
ncbi:RDD family protein [Pseudooceanicola batsensis HTCC2597]|uniref:RDD family protein n=1 Tax=Pseudooceanicola batsensis (strain ATCC BAA-863 / DSM 15984 / KCTC 12145 / HTCC2597) TaxID=252305 RepID=A3TWZ5_PSEBH|nr:RDD family protein [Pseudooceanicola batsensis]EAQ03355.1 RDD family protein [Pseudooceanicola batsensis HTCC2597]